LYDEAATHHPVISLLSRDYSCCVYNTHHGEACQDYNSILKFKANGSLRGRETKAEKLRKGTNARHKERSHKWHGFPGPSPVVGSSSLSLLNLNTYKAIIYF